jgi:hypothetical protein
MPGDRVLVARWAVPAPACRSTGTQLEFDPG